VPELRRQVRLVEVADPLRVTVTVGLVEGPLSAVQSDRARPFVTTDGVPVGLQDGRFRPDRGDTSVGCRTVSGPGQVDRLHTSTQIRGLVTHSGEDFRAERTVPSC